MSICKRFEFCSGKGTSVLWISTARIHQSRFGFFCLLAASEAGVPTKCHSAARKRRRPQLPLLLFVGVIDQFFSKIASESNK